MASSHCFPSTSPTAVQDTDVFSDDSGVDLKLQMGRNASGATESNSKRNKRKSSEPKKRKDVLLMKKFRWDTDEEDLRVDEDVFEDSDRPSSGDSGCHLEQCHSTSQSTEKKNPWRKCTVEENYRKSVICNIESTSTSPCTSTDPTLTVPLIAVKSGRAKLPENHPSNNYVQENEMSSTAKPRNYKSMSRQRRIEANARERTRVHTISAAFENLRRAVPAYAHNQKLSKLAILRIASAYIVALACLSEQGSEKPSLVECVERCTKTIQAEGRSRRRNKVRAFCTT